MTDAEVNYEVKRLRTLLHDVALRIEREVSHLENCVGHQQAMVSADELRYLVAQIRKGS